MANQYVQVQPDSTGKKVQTFENTISAQVVEAQGVVAVNASGTAIDTATAAPAGTEVALIVRNIPSGTQAVTQSGTWTVQPGNTANTTPWLVKGHDGTNAWTVRAGSSLPAAADTALVVTTRDTVTVAGTVTANIGTTNGLALDATLTNRTAKSIPTDGTRDATIKAASTAALAADTSLVVALSPNSAIPTGANVIGAVTQSGTWTVTANAGTNLNTSALALSATQTDRTQKTQITDGTRDGTVKAASTAAAAGDTSLVVALSPNSAIPTGANVIGAVTQSGTWTVQPGNTANTTPWLVKGHDGTNAWTVRAGSSLPAAADTALVVTTRDTVTISGTVTANAGTNLNTSALALDATLTNRTQKTQITDGTRDGTVKAASTAAIAADTSLVVALSPNSPLPTGANVIGAVTQSGAPWSVSQSGTWTVQPGNTANTTPWLVKLHDGTTAFTVKAASTAAVAADTAVVVAISPNNTIAATQSGAWSVTANAGTNLNTSALALSATQTDRTQKAQITDGTRDGTIKAASTAAAAADTSLVVALSPNSAIPTGANVIGAVTQSGTWTVQPGNTQNNTAWYTATIDSTTPGGSVQLNALGVTVTVPIAGLHGVGLIISAGTFVGVIVPEVSYDGGTSWVSSYFYNPSTQAKLLSLSTTNPSDVVMLSLVVSGGVSHARVRVVSYQGGTSNCTLRATVSHTPDSINAATFRNDTPTNADTALVVAISPNGNSVDIDQTSVLLELRRISGVLRLILAQLGADYIHNDDLDSLSGEP